MANKKSQNKNQNTHKEPQKEPQQTQQTAAEPTSNDKAKSSATAVEKADQPVQRVPLSWRLFDLFFVVTYLIIFVIILVIFVARCNKIMPSGEYALKEMVCPNVKILESSMGDALETYRGWVDKVYNTKVSLAITCAHRMNTFVVAPLSLYLAYAFFVGSDGAKNLAMVHCVCMFYGMVIQDTVGWHALLERRIEVVGAEASTFFLVTFGFATFFPFVVLSRIWPAKPFSMEEYYKQLQIGLCDALLNYIGMLACWVWLAMAMIFYYEFCVKNVSIARGLPSVFDQSNEFWDQTAPQREAMMEYAEPYTTMAQDYAQQAQRMGSEYATQVGEYVVQTAKQMQGK